MSASRYLFRVWHRTRSRFRPVVEGLQPPGVFRGIVRREQARADRNAHVFSVVTFQVEESTAPTATLQSIAKKVARRKRITDIAGQLDDETVAVLLPETPGIGAQQFAHFILRHLVECDGTPVCRIYVYPSPRSSNTDPEPDERQLWFSDVMEGSEPSGQPISTSSLARIPAQERAFSEIAPAVVLPPPRWKRLVDVLLAGTAMLLLAPLMLVIAVVIKLVSPGPVLYAQQRVGYLGRTFNCLKFRTMHVDADPSKHREHVGKLLPGEHPMTKLDVDDPRIIPLGRALRLTGLDELPQLVNVLRGEMSLIGPRPCMPYESAGFKHWQNRRFDTIPGLTGLWQVSGKNKTTFNQMMRLDIAYARRHSLWTDIDILFKTLPAIAAQVWEHWFGRAGRPHRDGISKGSADTRAGAPGGSHATERG